MHRQSWPLTTKALSSLSKSLTELKISSFREVKNEELIDQVVAEAEKLFVDGHKKHEELKENIQKNPSIIDKIRPDTKNGCFHQYKDNNFISYDANQIEGTNFIASAGPKPLDVGNFLKSMAFNNHLEIKEIVALGAYLGSDYYEESQDFCDYMSESNIFFNHSDFIVVDVDKISGQIDRTLLGLCLPQTIVKSKLTLKLYEGEYTTFTAHELVKIKKMNVTLYPLSDGRPIKLSQMKPGQELEQTLEILWQLFQKSLKEYIVVHCAAGLGRTGHLILFLELLKHYDEIFASQDPVIIAKEILKVLERLRKNRPSLVLEISQFSHAIRNTEILHRYDLRNRNVQHSVFSQNYVLFNQLQPLRPQSSDIRVPITNTL